MVFLILFTADALCSSCFFPVVLIAALSRKPTGRLSNEAANVASVSINHAPMITIGNIFHANATCNILLFSAADIHQML